MDKDNNVAKQAVGSFNPIHRVGSAFNEMLDNSADTIRFAPRNIMYSAEQDLRGLGVLPKLSDPPEVTWEEPPDLRGRVVKKYASSSIIIEDADTIITPDNVVIRLKGADTPETSIYDKYREMGKPLNKEEELKYKADPEEESKLLTQYYGNEATAVTRKLFKDTEEIFIVDYGLDVHGRTLGGIYTKEGISLAETLLKEGAAISALPTNKYYEHTHEAKRNYQLMLKARAEGKGMWSKHHITDPAVFRSNPRISPNYNIKINEFLTRKAPSKTEQFMEYQGTDKLYSVFQYQYKPNKFKEAYQPYVKNPDPVMPSYAIPMHESFYTSKRKQNYVPKFQRLYSARKPEGTEVPEAIVELDDAINKRSFVDNVNARLGYTYLDPDQGILGSLVSSTGRGIDTLFGYHERKELEWRERNQGSGSVRALQKFVGKKPPEEVGQFEAIAGVTYGMVENTSIAIAAYVGINLPLKHLMARLHQGTIESYFSFSPTNAKGLGRQIDRLALNTMFGKQGEQMWMASQHRYSFEASKGGLVILPGKPSTKRELSESYRHLQAAITHVTNKTAAAVRYVDSAPGVPNFADMTEEAQRELINQATDDAIQDLKRTARSKGIVDDVNDDIMPFIKGHVVSLDYGSELELEDKSVMKLTKVARAYNAQRFENVIAPFLESMNVHTFSYNRKSAFQVYKASIKELIATLKASPEVFFDDAKGVIETKHLGSSRITQVAKAFDRVSSLLPANMIRWVPGLRDAFGLDDFDIKEHMTWMDLFPMEKASKAVENSLSTIKNSFGFGWRSVEGNQWKPIKFGIELAKTVGHITKTTFNTFKTSFSLLRRQSQLSGLRRKVDAELVEIVEGVQGGLNPDYNEFIDNLRSQGLSDDEIWDAFYEQETIRKTTISNEIRNLEQGELYQKYKGLKSEVDKDFSKFNARNKASAARQVRHPLLNADFALTSSADLTMPVADVERSMASAKRIRGMQKGLGALFLAALVNKAIISPLMSRDIDYFTQLKAKEAFKEDETALLQTTATAPKSWILGAAGVGFIGGGLLFMSQVEDVSTEVENYTKVRAAMQSDTLSEKSFASKLGNQIQPRSQQTLAKRRAYLQSKAQTTKQFRDTLDIYTTKRSKLKFNVVGGLLSAVALTTLVRASMTGIKFFNDIRDPESTIPLSEEDSLISSFYESAAANQVRYIRSKEWQHTTRRDHAIASQLVEVSGMYLKSDEAEKYERTMYNIATQVTSPFFQMTALVRVDAAQQKMSFGFGLQLSPILGMGFSPTLPVAFRMREKSKRQDVLTRKLSSIDGMKPNAFVDLTNAAAQTRMLAAEIGLAAYTGGSNLVYEGDSPWLKSFEFIGALALVTTVSGSLGTKASKVYKNHLSKYSAIRREVRTLRKFANSWPVRAAKPILVGLPEMTATIPSYMAKGALDAPDITLKKFQTPKFLGKKNIKVGVKGALLGVMAMEVVDDLTHTYVEDDSMYTGLRVAAFFGAPTLAGWHKFGTGRVAEATRVVGKKAMPYYAAMFVANMLTSRGSSYAGYSIDKDHKRGEAMIGMTLTLGAALSLSGAMASEDDLIEEYYRRLYDRQLRGQNIQQVHRQKLERLTRTPGKGSPHDKILDEVLDAKLDSKAVKKRGWMSIGPLMSDTDLEAIVGAKLWGKQINTYEKARAKQKALQGIIEKGSPVGKQVKELIGRPGYRAMAARTRVAAMTWVGYSFVASSVSAFDRDTRARIYDLPVLGEVFRIMTGEPVYDPFDDDQLPDDFRVRFLKTFASKLNPLNIVKKSGMYTDKPDPFIETSKAFGLSLKERGANAYFQLASDVVDLSASAIDFSPTKATFRESKEHADLLVKYTHRSKSGSLAYATWRGRPARKTGMSISPAVTDYERKFNSSVLVGRAVALRSSRATWVSMQRAAELQMDIYGDMVASGYIDAHHLGEKAIDKSWNPWLSMGSFRMQLVQASSKRVATDSRGREYDKELYAESLEDLLLEEPKFGRVGKDKRGKNFWDYSGLSVLHKLGKEIGSNAGFVGSAVFGVGLPMFGAGLLAFSALTTARGIVALGTHARASQTLEESYTSRASIFANQEHRFYYTTITDAQGQKVLTRVDLAEGRGRGQIVASMDRIVRGQPNISIDKVQKRMKTAYNQLRSSVQDTLLSNLDDMMLEASRLAERKGFGAAVDRFKELDIGTLKVELKRTLKQQLSQKLFQGSDFKLADLVFEGLDDINANLEDYINELIDSKTGVSVVDEIIEGIYSTIEENVVKLGNKHFSRSATELTYLDKNQAIKGLLERITGVQGPTVDISMDAHALKLRKEAKRRRQQNNILNNRKVQKDINYKSRNLKGKVWAKGFLGSSGDFMRGLGTVVQVWDDATDVYEMTEGTSLLLSSKYSKQQRAEGFTGAASGAIRFGLGIAGLAVGGAIASAMALPSLLAAGLTIGLAIGIGASLDLIPWALKQNKYTRKLGKYIDRDQQQKFLNWAGTKTVNFLESDNLIASGIRPIADYAGSRVAGLLEQTIAPMLYDLHGGNMKPGEKMSPARAMLVSLLAPTSAFFGTFSRERQQKMDFLEELQSRVPVGQMPLNDQLHAEYLGALPYLSSKLVGQPSPHDWNRHIHEVTFGGGSRVLSSFARQAYQMSSLQRMALVRRNEIWEQMYYGSSINRRYHQLEAEKKKGYLPLIRSIGEGLGVLVLGGIVAKKSAASVQDSLDFMISKISPKTANKLFGYERQAYKEARKLTPIKSRRVAANTRTRAKKILAKYVGDVDIDSMSGIQLSKLSDKPKIRRAILQMRKEAFAARMQAKLDGLDPDVIPSTPNASGKMQRNKIQIAQSDGITYYDPETGTVHVSEVDAQILAKARRTKGGRSTPEYYDVKNRLSNVNDLPTSPTPASSRLPVIEPVKLPVDPTAPSTSPIPTQPVDGPKGRGRGLVTDIDGKNFFYSRVGDKWYEVEAGTGRMTPASSPPTIDPSGAPQILPKTSAANKPIAWKKPEDTVKPAVPSSTADPFPGQTLDTDPMSGGRSTKGLVRGIEGEFYYYAKATDKWYIVGKDGVMKPSSPPRVDVGGVPQILPKTSKAQTPVATRWGEQPPVLEATKPIGGIDEVLDTIGPSTPLSSSTSKSPSAVDSSVDGLMSKTSIFERYRRRLDRFISRISRGEEGGSKSPRIKPSSTFEGVKPSLSVKGIKTNVSRFSSWFKRTGLAKALSIFDAIDLYNSVQNASKVERNTQNLRKYNDSPELVERYQQEISKSAISASGDALSLATGVGVAALTLNPYLGMAAAITVGIATSSVEEAFGKTLGKNIASRAINKGVSGERLADAQREGWRAGAAIATTAGVGAALILGLPATALGMVALGATLAVSAAFGGAAGSTLAAYYETSGVEEGTERLGRDLSQAGSLVLSDAQEYYSLQMKRSGYALRRSSDAIGYSVKKLGASIKSSTNLINKKIQSGINKTVSSTKVALERTTEAIVSSKERMSSTIKRTGDNISSGVLEAWEGITSTTSRVWTTTTSGIKRTGDNISSGALEAWEGVTSAVGGAWEGITSAVGGAWTTTTSGIKRTAVGMMSTTSRAIGNTASTINRTAKNMWSATTSTASKALNYVSNLISEKVNRVPPTTGDELDMALSEFENSNSTSPKWREYIRKLEEQGLTKDDAMIQLSGAKWFSKLGQFLQNGISAVMGQAANAFNYIKGLGVKAIDATRNVLDSAGDFIGSVLGSAGTMVGNAWDAMRRWTGIGRSRPSGYQNAESAVPEFMNVVRNRLRAALGMQADADGLSSAELLEKGLSAEDQKLIALMIRAESRGEDSIGQRLVAAVIMNRIAMVQAKKATFGTYGGGSEEYVRAEIDRLNALGGVQLKYTGSVTQRLLLGERQFEPVRSKNNNLVLVSDSSNIQQGYEILEASFDREKLVQDLKNKGFSSDVAQRMSEATGFRIPKLNVNVSYFRPIAIYEGHSFGSDDVTKGLDIEGIVEKLYKRRQGDLTTAPKDVPVDQKKNVDIDSLFRHVRYFLEGTAPSEAFESLNVYKGPHYLDDSPKGSYDYTLSRKGNQYVGIPAPFSGVVMDVRSAETSGGYGYDIIIYDPKTNLSHRIAHNQSLKVKKGDRFSKGQIIAVQGSTGHSTGPHVHHEIYKGPITYPDSIGRRPAMIRDRSITRPIVESMHDYWRGGQSKVTDKQADEALTLMLKSAQKGKAVTPALLRWIVSVAGTGDDTDAIVKQIEQYNSTLSEEERTLLKRIEEGKEKDPFQKIAARTPDTLFVAAPISLDLKYDKGKRKPNQIYLDKAPDGQKELPNKIVYTVGHYDTFSVGEGKVGSRGERVFVTKVGYALEKLATQLGIEVEFIKPETTKKLHLNQVGEMLRKEMKKPGVFAFELHADADADYGAAGIIPGTKIDAADIALGKEFGAFPQKQHRGFMLPRRNVALLEVASMQYINKLSDQDEQKAAEEKALRIIRALFPKQLQDYLDKKDLQSSAEKQDMMASNISDAPSPMKDKKDAMTVATLNRVDLPNANTRRRNHTKVVSSGNVVASNFTSRLNQLYKQADKHLLEGEQMLLTDAKQVKYRPVMPEYIDDQVAMLDFTAAPEKGGELELYQLRDLDGDLSNITADEVGEYSRRDLEMEREFQEILAGYRKIGNESIEAAKKAETIAEEVKKNRVVKVDNLAMQPESSPDPNAPTRNKTSPQANINVKKDRGQVNISIDIYDAEKEVAYSFTKSNNRDFGSEYQMMDPSMG